MGYVATIKDDPETHLSFRLNSDSISMPPSIGSDAQEYRGQLLRAHDTLQHLGYDAGKDDTLPVITARPNGPNGQARHRSGFPRAKVNPQPDRKLIGGYNWIEVNQPKRSKKAKDDHFLTTKDWPWVDHQRVIGCFLGHMICHAWSAWWYFQIAYHILQNPSIYCFCWCSIGIGGWIPWFGLAACINLKGLTLDVVVSPYSSSCRRDSPHFNHVCLAGGVFLLDDMFWLVVWNVNFMTFPMLGMSSSQLTNSYFSEG